MPLYEYKCHACGKKFEVIQKFSDEPLKTHPECGGEVERLLSAPALQFKGTGWYVTDYAKSNSGAPAKSGDAKSETKSETKSESSSETKTDSKPAASSNTKSPAA